jgi:L-lactate dehydrogenase complex protein LldG
MSGRNAILAALRSAAPSQTPLPPPPDPITYPDPVKQFADVLASVGGKAVLVESASDLDAEVRKLDACAQASRIASRVPGVSGANVDVGRLHDPHELEGIDLAILPGSFGVAENAAVWVDEACLGPHRAIFVIAQHLALVVPANSIVHNMQEAYARIKLQDAGFGVFISGPSKTADIEQSLVIGAHGARSCTVLVVGKIQPDRSE